MRIAGLASGMDIDSIVKDLMRAERMPLDKLKQKKQILEWQRDDYRAINTKLLSFRDKLAQLKLTSNYRARTTSSSNDAYVSATATSGASQASYSISEVTQLASAATRVNAGEISGDSSAKIDPTKSLHSQDSAFATGITWSKGVVESKTQNIKENTNAIDLGVKKDNIQETVVKVNGKLIPPAEYEIGQDGKITFVSELKKDDKVKIDYVLKEKTVEFTYSGEEEPPKQWSIGVTNINVTSILIGENDVTDQLVKVEGSESKYKIDNVGVIDLATGIITFDELEEGETPPSDIKLTYTQNYSNIELNTHTSKGEVNEKIFFTSSDSLNSVIRKVNDSDAGVTMFYDSFSDQVTLTRKETGDYNQNSAVNGGNEINVSGDFMTKVLKFEGSTETGGKNAMFTINGLTTERTSNTFDMNGVTFTLKQKFAKDSIEPATISIANDTNQVFENIKEFVNQYNELIAEISGKLNEERHRSYKPLTDDEREELSDKQQEKWEEMAKSGLLKGDPLLSGVLTNMRLDMSSVVETNGLFSQLASIGISTTSNYLDGGKLQINEAKLKEAIEQDPDSVESLFRSDGSTSDLGIIHKLYNTVDASLNRLREKAGRATSTNQQFSIGRELLNVDKSIDRFEDKMKITEDRYWRQFTAMEKAIQRANQQSMFLMNQFGGM
ncbi:flagellar filament capping protein FliD [Lederbergia graminis]|uniref:Flagellar hook-associated protein 2 n=1 Tax=Lederbergia graminis TaxID=735518 RepID=A0ABW0LMF0_9BACI